MFTFIEITRILLPLLYVLTTLLYGLRFFNNSHIAQKFKTKSLVATIILHLVYIVSVTAEFRHIPMTSVFELFCMLSFTLAVAYTLVELITKVKNTGFFVLCISSLLISIYAAFAKDYYDMKDILKSEFLVVHVTAALIGCSAFALSAIYGLLYIILYHKLRSRVFDNVYHNLPNLETLETMITRAIVVGFLALSFSICSGMIWLRKAIQNFSYTDIKLITTLLIWLIYAVGLAVKRFTRAQGKRIALLSIVSFIVMFVCMLFAGFLSAFHKFY